MAEYWVVDPDLDEIKMYRLSSGRFVRVTELSVERDDVLTSPLVPCLALRLAEIFEE